MNTSSINLSMPPQLVRVSNRVSKFGDINEESETYINTNYISSYEKIHDINKGYQEIHIGLVNGNEYYVRDYQDPEGFQNVLDILG